jgi:hypothetical protein
MRPYRPQTIGGEKRDPVVRPVSDDLRRDLHLLFAVGTDRRRLGVHNRWVGEASCAAAGERIGAGDRNRLAGQRFGRPVPPDQLDRRRLYVMIVRDSTCCALRCLD